MSTRISRRAEISEDWSLDEMSFEIGACVKNRASKRRSVGKFEAKHIGDAGKLATKTECGKTRYRDHKEAAQALHRIEVKRKWFDLEGMECRRKESRIYFHPACKGFHLTSQRHDNGGMVWLIEEAA